MTRLKYIFLSGPLAFLIFILHDFIGSNFNADYDWKTEAVGKATAPFLSASYITRPLLLLFYILSIFCIILAILYFKTRIDNVQRFGLMVFALALIVSLLSYEVFPMVDMSVGSTLRNNMHMIMSKSIFWIESIALFLLILGANREWGEESIGKYALFTLLFMIIAYIAIPLLPHSIFGIIQRATLYIPYSYVAYIGAYIYKRL